MDEDPDDSQLHFQTLSSIQLANSQICYWFDRVPREIREVLTSHMDISTFLKFMMSSTLCNRESNEASNLVLNNYKFSLKLAQMGSSYVLELQCDSDSRFGEIKFYEGRIKLAESPENGTEINITRIRYPHESDYTKEMLEYRSSKVGWNENKNVHSSILHYLKSYLNTYGKNMHTIEIIVESRIATQISQLFINVEKFEKLSDIIRIHGPRINFGQLMKLNTRIIKCSNLYWSRRDVLMMLRLWKYGTMKSEITKFELQGRFTYNDDINEYIRRHLTRSEWRESNGYGDVYTFFRFQYQTKIIVTRPKCTFEYVFQRRRLQPW